MLEVKEVCKTYQTKKRIGLFKTQKSAKQAASNISLQLERGQIIGVLGENGAGKTTLIKMMTTLLLPDTGEILIDGENINQDLKKTRRKINMISGGERNLYWRLTAMENLLYFGSLYGLSKKEITDKSEILLKEIGLWKERHTPVEQFSKGMKQRLQIVKGLINNPEYLFLDEPTLGLDVEISRELRQRVKDIARKQNTGILLTTHYMAEAEELCDYIYIIDNGTIILSGKKEEVFQALDLEKEITVSVLSENISDQILELKKVLPISDIESKDEFTTIKICSKNPNLQEIIKRFTQHNFEISEIKLDNPTLETALIVAKKRSRNTEL
jgi:ABC-2 type transport system ATP-binding protein